MAENSQILQPSSELTSNDLQKVLKAVYSISPDNVINFGLELGVTRDQISAFETQYHRNMKQCLREILDESLKLSPPLTWNRIVQALQSQAVGEYALARNIQSRYRYPSSDPQQHPSAGPQQNLPSPSDPQQHPFPHNPQYPPPTHPTYTPQYPPSQHPPHNPQYTPPPHHTQYLPPQHHPHYPSFQLTTHTPYNPHPQHPPHNLQYLLTQYPHHNLQYLFPQSPHYNPPPQHHPHILQYPPSQNPHHPPLQQPPHNPQYPPPQLSQYPHPQSPTYHSQYPLSPSHTHSDWTMAELGPSPPKRQLSLGEVTSQFIDYVKTIYRSSEVERDIKVVKWPPTPSKVFINLACIDRISVRRGDYDEITKAMVRDGNVDVIVGSKRLIHLSEVARDVTATDKKVILVEGAPGVGKSTFAWEFCRRWEREEIAQQYQLVLLLRLRDERMSRAKSLSDLIYHPKESVSEAVSSELIDSHGLHALIILEGYDELPERCRSDHSIFLQLIAGKVLPLATVLVTSRPWATGSIRNSHDSRIYQHIEILGFTSQQITKYMESTLLPDQVSNLSLYLERHPQIRMCMYIPLNSAIVVTVYQESQAGTLCALPTTRTELYTALARTLLLRYLRSHPEYESGTKPLKTFSDLPPMVYGRFSKLCKLAYRGIAGNRYHVRLIFNDSDLPPDFDSLGLMDSVTELYVTEGTVSSHNFLHLTFQEFLAAVHISTMSPSDQLEHFQRHEDGRYRVVLRFLAGLKKLSCFTKDTIKNIFTDTDRSVSPYSVACDVDVTIDLVNWMFEAQSDDVISLLDRKIVSVCSNNEYLLLLDYYSLGYCIAHSQCQWVLSLNGDIGEDQVTMLVAGVSTRHETSGRVVGLRQKWDINDKDQTNMYFPLSISAEGLNMLFTQLKSVLHLHELHLDLPVPCDGISWPDLSGLRVLTLGIRGEVNWRLDSLLPHLPLESLTITACRVGDNNELVYNDCVAIRTTCVKELCVRNTNAFISIGNEGMEEISEALADNQSLPLLERLKLNCLGRFTDTAGECLAQFITNTTTLQHLTIHYCKFSPHRLLSLVNALHRNSTLQEKSLNMLTVTVNGDIEAEKCAQLLVDNMVNNTGNITHLQCTNISDAGAVALAKALHHHSTLEDLDLSYNNNIGDSVAVALAQTLHHNSTLKVMDLSCNINISDAGVEALAQALHHNSTLKWLHLSNNSISDTGSVALAQALHQNCTLAVLNLSGNDAIGKEGIHQLVQALTVNTSITKNGVFDGLRLPWKCKEYATQCTQYNEVKDRITFWKSK